MATIATRAGRNGMRAAARYLVLPLLALGATAAAESAVEPRRYVWEDPFTAPEQARLRAWIEETTDALERLVGPFPMPIRVHFHRRDGAREPVPWANTERSRTQGVHFHVDPHYTLEDFRRDWTAPHELSHLILPYLGRRQAWFAEGFASYLQYQVMAEMGVLSEADALARYQRNFERAERGYGSSGQPFVNATPRLRAEGKYPVMYWGGAAFFLQADHALANRDQRLIDVLRVYLACCRRDRARLDDLLGELDRLAGGSIFRDGLRRFRGEPGFPDFRSYHPPGT